MSNPIPAAIIGPSGTGLRALIDGEKSTEGVIGRPARGVGDSHRCGGADAACGRPPQTFCPPRSVGSMSTPTESDKVAALRPRPPRRRRRSRLHRHPRRCGGVRVPGPQVGVDGRLACVPPIVGTSMLGDTDFRGRRDRSSDPTLPRSLGGNAPNINGTASTNVNGNVSGRVPRHDFGRRSIRGFHRRMATHRHGRLVSRPVRSTTKGGDRGGSTGDCTGECRDGRQELHDGLHGVCCAIQQHRHLLFPNMSWPKLGLSSAKSTEMSRLIPAFCEPPHGPGGPAHADPWPR